MRRRSYHGVLLCLLLLVPLWARAQDFEFHPPANAADPASANAMRDLAERVLPVYQENDPERYLANLSVLQLVAGNFVAADQTREQLRDRRRAADAARTPGHGAMLDLYTHAKAVRESDHVPFQQAFAQAFRDVVPKLNNFDAYALTTMMSASPAPQQAAVQKSFDQHRAKGSLTLNEAVDLLSAYLNFDVQRTVSPLVAQLDAEDDQQRYTNDPPILVTQPHGPALSVLVVRPRTGPQTLPTLLEFTDDASVNYARECAAHGYIGVVAYARGIAGSHGRPLPFEHDGDDARAVIAWIVKQPWSDGRVGMYGSGYSGFAAWAAAKHLPSALKAIATADPLAPGIDFPMTGGVFHNESLRWAYEHTVAAAQADRPDDAAWRAANEAWYTSGKAYRALRAPGGKYVQIFTRWLNHPSYDLYWQKMVSTDRELAKLDIPVLTMTGYYASGAPGALWYFDRHQRLDQHADHRLFIGPYDAAATRHTSAATLNGLGIDANAQLNLRELRYQWFDSIFRGGRRPPLLQERVNYLVPGTNEWRHVGATASIANGTLKYFLDAADPKAADERYRLATRKPAVPLAATQVVSFTDRSDAGWAPATDLVTRILPVRNGIAFASEPLAKPVELAGFISGHLVLKVNRMDVDLSLSAYELNSSGDYVKLFDPEFEFRASYQKDRVHRHLLQAGVREELAFRSERMASRKLQAGSRLVIVLTVLKRSDREINYGKGDDVSAESIADARPALKLRWYSDSSIEFPRAHGKVMQADRADSAAFDAWTIAQAAAVAIGRFDTGAYARFTLAPSGQLRAVGASARESEGAAVLEWWPDRGWEALLAQNDPRRDLLELYLPISSATPSRPITVGHLGQSLDGFIATSSGDSCYVTGPENILHLHRLRALCDAVVIGAGTVAADNPRLTTRLVAGSNPVRVILDPGGRLPAEHSVFSDCEAPTLRACLAGEGAERARARGEDVLEVAARAQALDLADLVRQLHARGFCRIFVEGGGVTVSSFLEAGLLDRLQIAVAPLLIGEGRPAIRIPAQARLQDCLRLKHRVYRAGDDILFDCDLRAAPDTRIADTATPEPAAVAHRELEPGTARTASAHSGAPSLRRIL